jgi:glyoxylase-like metal-dependent hydrolase (beta-lactamase superfamily II)
MKAADDYDEVRPGLWYWQIYEAAVKTDLCSCAVRTGEGLVFCDPARLAPAALEMLAAECMPRAIVLTNGNHQRDSAALARKFGIEIWAATDACGEVAATRWFEPGETLFGEIATVPLPGFAAGETALYIGETLIIGDALINIAPHGFAMLPEKYCSDAKVGRASLKQLSQRPISVICFAHGLPIVTDARRKLAELLAQL